MAPNQRIILIGPFPPFRGGIALYSAFLGDALRERRPVRFLGLRRQFFSFLYPGRRQTAAAPHTAPTLPVERILDTYNPLTWLWGGWQGDRETVFLIPWWVTFWVPYYLLLLFVARRRGARVVFLCHNVIEHDPGAVSLFLTRQILRHGDGFVVQTSEQRDLLQRLLPRVNADRVLCRHHPSYGCLRVRPFDCGHVRRQLDIPSRETVFLFFGFIKPYKGVDLLIDAVPLVLRKQLECRIFIIGEVWKNDPSYQRHIDQQDLSSHVKLIDEYVPQETLDRYLTACDAAVFPYRSGTGSGAAQLALGSGRPVIASDLPVFRETLTPKKEALFFKVNDSVSLASIMLEFAGGHKHRMIRHCERHARDDTSWADYAADLDQWLERLP